MKPLCTAVMLTALVCAAGVGSVGAERLIISDQPPTDAVAVRDLVVHDDGEVEGVLVNRSSPLVRDVRLLIRHTWLWRDEKHPGEDNPSRAAFHVVASPLPPGETVRFHYRPEPPLPERRDGRFETAVEVVGLTEIGR